jgi:hypothetical protein
MIMINGPRTADGLTACLDQGGDRPVSLRFHENETSEP